MEPQNAAWQHSPPGLFRPQRPAQSLDEVHVIGVACELGARVPGCALGPQAFLDSQVATRSQAPGLRLTPELMLRPTKRRDLLHCLRTLARRCAQLSHARQRFLVIGGDHSCAIGTWSGAAAGLADRGPLGLLWIDAHMDSHTPATSPSGALHGMPLACLLGHGEDEYTRLLRPTAKLRPRDICLLGVRSHEAEEARLLQQLGVRVLFMADIHARGLDACMREALRIVSRDKTGFGISIDLDAIDPRDAPGVGSPVEDGIPARDLCRTLRGIATTTGFLGLELAELNPLLDRAGKTLRLCTELSAACLARPLAEHGGTSS